METSGRDPQDRPHGSTTRPYRSKRHPPCAQCRRKKLRCDPQTDQGCQRCKKAGLECSFKPNSHLSKPLSTLRPKSAEPEQTPQAGTEIPSDKSREYPRIASFQPDQDVQQLSQTPDDPASGFPSSPLSLPNLPEVPTPQAIQTLDLLKGCSSQVIGASGESDPWLLQHCKFDERGFLLVHQVHFRNAGGVPLDEKIPVHFLVTTDSLYESSKRHTRITNGDILRARLQELVPMEYGPRLFSL